MAPRTWLSTGSTDANLATNYSGSGALLSTDDIVLDGTSVIDWNTTADLTVKSVSISSAFTGSHLMDHQWTITGAAGWVDNGTLASGKTRDYNGNIIFTGSGGTCTLGFTGGTTQCDDLFLYFNSTNQTWVMNVNKLIGLLSIGDNSSCAISGSGLTWVKGLGDNGTNDGRLLYLGTSATLTMNKYLVLEPTASTNVPYVLGSGYTITGASNVYLYIYSGANDITIGLPTITLGNALGLYINGYAKTGVVYNQLGQINTGWKLKISATTSNGDFTFDHNGYTWITGSDYELALGTTVGTNHRIYARDAVLVLIGGSFVCSSNGGNHYYDFGQCGFIIYGNFTINATFIPVWVVTRWNSNGGFAWIRLISTNITPVTINCQGTKQILPNLRVETVGKTVQLLSDVHCDMFTNKGATLDYNGKNIYSYDDSLTEFDTL